MLEIWKLLSFHFLLVKFIKICWLAYLLVGNIGAITTRDFWVVTDMTNNGGIFYIIPVTTSSLSVNETYWVHVVSYSYYACCTLCGADSIPSRSTSHGAN